MEDQDFLLPPATTSGLLTRHLETRLCIITYCRNSETKIILPLIVWFIFILAKLILFQLVNLNTMGTILLIKPVKILIIQMRPTPLNSYSCINLVCCQNEIPEVEYFVRRIKRRKGRKKRRRKRGRRRKKRKRRNKYSTFVTPAWPFWGADSEVTRSLQPISSLVITYTKEAKTCRPQAFFSIPRLDRRNYPKH